MRREKESSTKREIKKKTLAELGAAAHIFNFMSIINAIFHCIRAAFTRHPTTCIERFYLSIVAKTLSKNVKIIILTKRHQRVFWICSGRSTYISERMK